MVPVALLAVMTAVHAEDIDGVQPAALDQPRINLVVRRTNHGPLLTAKAENTAVANVEAFLDTGASGVLLSDHTATQLGVRRETVAGGTQARFEDVGVGGDSSFAVSEPLFVSLASSNADTEDAPTHNGDNIYTHTVGPLRAQVGPLGGGIMDSLVKELTGDLDVAGMPAMQGMVVVMDPGKLNKIEDKITTTLITGHAPNTKRHIRLSYASFEPFTKTLPAGAAGPLMAANPFIGPNPIRRAGDKTPAIYAFANGKFTAGSWLLDTGAATSMISLKQAAAIGVTYAPGTFDSSAPELLGVAKDRQFTMTIGGIGGSKKSAGFYLDGLRLFTTEGQPLTFLHAPVLVADITVKNTLTKQEMTLDGVFGMNYLVASAKLDADNPVPDIGAITPGAFSLIVFDQPHGLLGLN